MVNLKKDTGNDQIRLSELAVFEVVYLGYYHPLCQYAKRLVGDMAEDLIENLFVKLWHKKQIFKDAGHLRAFLYRATRNACLDYIKTCKRYDMADIELAADIVVSEEDHLGQLISAELQAEIYRAIYDLPSQSSKVITLSFLEGLENLEIARELGLSEQTIKNLKVKGLAVLRNKLSKRAFALLLILGGLS